MTLQYLSVGNMINKNVQDRHGSIAMGLHTMGLYIRSLNAGNAKKKDRRIR